MSERDAPNYVTPEGSAGVSSRVLDRVDAAIERLAAIEAVQEQLPTTEFVRTMVTGARQSIEASIVELPSKDKIAHLTETVGTLATRESVSALEARVNAIGLPKFWQLIILALALAAFVGGVSWKAHDEVSGLDKRAAVLEVEVGALQKQVEQQSALITALLARRP